METTLRASLRDAIFRSGRSQVDVAVRARIHETRLSKIVRGRVAPTDREKRDLAKVLHVDVEVLFPSEQEVA